MIPSGIHSLIIDSSRDSFGEFFRIPSWIFLGILSRIAPEISPLIPPGILLRAIPDTASRIIIGIPAEFFLGFLP